MKRLISQTGITIIALLLVFSAHAAPKVITWEDLVPEEANAPSINFKKFTKQKGMPSLSEFDGSQRDMDDYIDNMNFMREMQPMEGNAIATKLNGQEVKLAGYVTPLTFDGDKVVDFLFVPYLGACMHVPPPEANQIVYVENAKGMSAEALDSPVWITGKLNATPVSTLVANVGYTITGAKLELYDE